MRQAGKPNFQALNEPTETKAGRWEGWIRMENRSPPCPQPGLQQQQTPQPLPERGMQDSVQTAGQPGSAPGQPGKMTTERMCVHTRVQVHMDMCIYMYKLGRAFEGNGLVK